MTVPLRLRWAHALVAHVSSEAQKHGPRSLWTNLCSETPGQCAALSVCRECLQQPNCACSSVSASLETSIWQPRRVVNISSCVVHTNLQRVGATFSQTGLILHHRHMNTALKRPSQKPDRAHSHPRLGSNWSGQRVTSLQRHHNSHKLVPKRWCRRHSPEPMEQKPNCPCWWLNVKLLRGVSCCMTDFPCAFLRCRCR